MKSHRCTREKQTEGSKIAAHHQFSADMMLCGIAFNDQPDKFNQFRQEKPNEIAAHHHISRLVTTVHKHGNSNFKR